jgi:hypothetical protein
MEKQTSPTFLGIFTTFVVLILGLIRGDFTIEEVLALILN